MYDRYCHAHSLRTPSAFQFRPAGIALVYPCGLATVTAVSMPCRLLTCRSPRYPTAHAALCWWCCLRINVALPTIFLYICIFVRFPPLLQSAGLRAAPRLPARPAGGAAGCPGRGGPPGGAGLGDPGAGAAAAARAIPRGREAAGLPARPEVRGNIGLALLTLQLARLPADLVRYVLTTRPDAAAGQVLPCLRRVFGAKEEAAAGGEAGTLGLAELRPRHFWSSVQPGTDEGSGSSSGGGGGGVLVCHTVEGLCRSLGLVGLPPLRPQQQDGHHTHSVAGRSGGQGDGDSDLAQLYSMYNRVFRHSFASYSTVQADQVRQLLAVLLAAQEPLTQAVVQQLGLRSVLMLLPGWGVLYFVDEHRVYSLHKSLADYLRGDVAGGAAARWAAQGSSWGGVDVRQGHLTLASLLAQPQALAAPSPYALKYLLHHLVMACLGTTGAGAAVAGVGAGGAGAGAAEAGAPAGAASHLLDTALAHFGFLQRMVAAGHAWRLVAALGPHAAALEAAGSQLCGDALRCFRAAPQDLDKGVLTMAMKLLPTGSALYALAVAAKEEQAGWGCTRVLPEYGWSACLAVMKVRVAATRRTTAGWRMPLWKQSLQGDRVFWRSIFVRPKHEAVRAVVGAGLGLDGGVCRTQSPLVCRSLLGSAS